MTTRLYLLRHGQVAPEWRHRVYGQLDVPLSDFGREQARVAAARVPECDRPPQLVLSSGLSRAAFGASLVAERFNLEPRVEPRFRELDRGDWAGLAFDDVPRDAWSAWAERPGTTRCPAGESLEDLSVRVLEGLDHWTAATAERTPAGAIAIVAHLWVLRVAVAAALQMPLDHAPRLNIGTGEMVVLDWPTGTEKTSQQRPTLVALAGDDIPSGSGWFRGPHRS